MDNVFSDILDIDENSFEVPMDFFRKIQQFFMSDFLHSKFPNMRWICGMLRADLFYRGVRNFTQTRFKC